MFGNFHMNLMFIKMTQCQRSTILHKSGSYVHTCKLENVFFFSLSKMTQSPTCDRFWTHYFMVKLYLGRVKRIWYLSPMRAAMVQASLRILAVSPEPPLLAHTSIESRGTFRQKARSQAPLNSWACAVKICHDGMLEDTNSLDGAHLFISILRLLKQLFWVSQSELF